MSNIIEPTAQTLHLKHLVTQHDLNPQGTLFGGILLGLMDQAGAIAAIKDCEKRILLLKVDDTLIKKTMNVADLLEFHAQVEKIGNTSITVRVDVWREKLLPKKDLEWTAGGILTYVAIDDNYKPTNAKS